MKFLKNLNFLVLIYYLIPIIKSLKTSRDQTLPKGEKPLEIFYEVNTAINRGYSFLNDHSSFMEKPATTLSKYNIFNYEIDLEKMIETNSHLNNLILEETGTDIKQQKILKEYSLDEMTNAQDFIISGNFKLHNQDFLYQRARSIKHKKDTKTLLYFHEKEEFNIQINNKTDFPHLNPVFLADALITFNGVEIKNFENQDGYLRKALAFVYKYGTHYLRKTRWGTRVTILTELKLKPEDLKASNETSEDSTDIKTGGLRLETAKDKKGDRYLDFDMSIEIGNCKVDTFKNELKDCDKKVSKMGLIGFDVDYIYNLFDSATMTQQLKLPDDSIVTPDKIDNIFKNLRNFVQALEQSMYIKNSIITDLQIYNNLGIDDKIHVGCLTDFKNPRFGPIKTSMFTNDHLVNKYLPIFKLTTKDQVNEFETSFMSKRKSATFACVNKQFNLVPDDIISVNLFNRGFIKDLQIVTNATLHTNKTINPEYCTNLWTGKTKENPKEFVVNYLCFNKTTNFLDPDLIVDIKVKSFNEDKCEEVYKYNFREYNCICDINLSQLVKKNTKVKRFLCYAKKTVLHKNR